MRATEEELRALVEFFDEHRDEDQVLLVDQIRKKFNIAPERSDIETLKAYVHSANASRQMLTLSANGVRVLGSYFDLFDLVRNELGRLQTRCQEEAPAEVLSDVIFKLNTTINSWEP